MFEGKRADGTSIEPPYSEVTRMIKRAKGQPVNRVTLKDEGDFHRSIQVEKQGGEFVMDATDFKTSRLVNKYGGNIFGFTDPNLDLVRETIKNDVLQIGNDYLRR
jgi:hypothetical protein